MVFWEWVSSIWDRRILASSSVILVEHSALPPDCGSSPVVLDWNLSTKIPTIGLALADFDYFLHLNFSHTPKNIFSVTEQQPVLEPSIWAWNLDSGVSSKAFLVVNWTSNGDFFYVSAISDFQMEWMDPRCEFPNRVSTSSA